jgi:hypothetical protein
MIEPPVEISLTDTDNNPQFVLWNCQKAALDLHTQCEELEAEIERLEASFRQLLNEAENVMAAYGTTNLAAVLSARFVADLARAALTKEDKE